MNVSFRDDFLLEPYIIGQSTNETSRIENERNDEYEISMNNDR